ncbi:MAG: glycosyltransferase family 9 protein [Rhodospirillaceae bacterium]
MRVLFITSNRLGDAVLSTGVLDQLVRRYPDARITVACGPVAATLFRALPGLERVITLEKQRHAGHWLGLWRQCIGRWWGLVVDLRDSAVSRLLFRRRSVVASSPPADRHRLEHLAGVFGLAAAPAPCLWLGAAERAAAAALIPDGPPVLALGPAANWIGKTWRPERFAALAGQLTGPGGLLPGARVAVLAAAGERDQAAPLLAAIDPARRLDLVGATDPLEAGACLARCALFIGNDSGLMHIAAAVGTPTLGLFGPSRPEHYRPWGRHCAWIRTPLSFEALLSAPDYDPDTTGTLMDGLEVEAVAAAAAALWQRTGAGKERA